MVCASHDLARLFRRRVRLVVKPDKEFDKKKASIVSSGAQLSITDADTILVQKSVFDHASETVKWPHKANPGRFD